MNHPAPFQRRVGCGLRPACHGFTLVEIIISLLMLTTGLLAVIGMTLTGTREAQHAMGLATAHATARTALYDPLLVDATKTATDSPITGFLNGYFVKRTILTADVAPGIDHVQVSVYWGDSGKELAGLVSLVQR